MPGFAHGRSFFFATIGVRQEMIGEDCISDGSFMADMDESDFSTDEFRALLGFVNTATYGQKKGYRGNAK